MINRFKSQVFTIGLVAMVFLAFYAPSYGATGGILKSEVTTKLAIALIFLLQGLTLDSRKLLSSVINIRLHLFCQSWIFVLSPLLMLLIVFTFNAWIPDNIRFGLLFLSVLPTTILSSTVFTTSSNGDAGAALFSATLSNLIGVFATPLWCLALFANPSGEFPPVGSLIAKIALYILFPIAVGQLFRIVSKNWIQTRKALIKRLNNGLILFVIYAAFCDSFANDIWNGFGLSSIIVAFALSTLFLALLSALVWTTSRLSSTQDDQRIAAFFCSTQKTLAAGVPMASVIFAGQTGSLQASLIIVPLMIYHALQLFLAGVVSGSFASKRGSENTD